MCSIKHKKSYIPWNVYARNPLILIYDIFQLLLFATKAATSFRFAACASMMTLFMISGLILCSISALYRHRHYIGCNRITLSFSGPICIANESKTASMRRHKLLYEIQTILAVLVSHFRLYFENVHIKFPHTNTLPLMRNEMKSV